jgi:hypothetical protein
VSIARDIQARTGETLTIPVNLDIAKDLESVQLRLDYDQNQLEILSVTRGSLTQGFEWFVERHAEGKVIVDMSAQSKLTHGTGSLIELTVKVKDTAAGTLALDLHSVYLKKGG